MVNSTIANFSIYERHKKLRQSLIILEFLGGLLASHHLCFYFLYTQKYDISLLAYSIIEVIVSSLFCLNPFMGYLADTRTFFGYKRKSYLLLIGFIGTFGYFLSAMTFYFNIPAFVAFIFHFCIDSSNAFRIVLMDSLCVTMNNYKKQIYINSKSNESTKSVAVVFASRLLGRVLSHSIFGLFYQYFNEKCILTRLLFPFFNRLFYYDSEF